MNCYDCQTEAAETTPSVATCRSCGAALCARHSHSVPHDLRRAAGMGTATRPVVGRRILCVTCHKAELSG